MKYNESRYIRRKIRHTPVMKPNFDYETEENNPANKKKMCLVRVNDEDCERATQPVSS